MKPPIIIVSEPGDVAVFESVRQAEVYLEAPDAKEDQIKAYDSEGHLLSVEAEPEPDQKIFGITIVDPGTVKIGRKESAITHEEDLRQVLVEFLIATGVDTKSLNGITLENVLAQLLTYQGFTR